MGDRKTEHEIEIVFEGPGVSPATVDARHVLQVALAYLDSLTNIGLVETGQDEPPFVLALTSIRKGSAAYRLKRVTRPVDPPDADVQLRYAAKRVKVYAAHPESSPKRVRPKVIRLMDYVRELPPTVAVEARAPSNKWSLTKTARRKAAPVMLTADTLRARILRAGGKEPRVQLLIDNDTASLAATREIATQAGALLYQEVEVEVELTHGPKAEHLEEDVGLDYPIIDGRILSLSPIIGATPVEAWDQWYQAAKTPWGEVEDIEAELKDDR